VVSSAKVARPPRPLVTLLAIVILCALPFLAIAAVEIAGRVFIWSRHGVPGHSYGIYEGHPVLKGILAPRSYNTGGQVINAQRFQRLDDTPDRPPADRLRVITYGGSTTICYNFPTPLCWPSQLEAHAKDKPAKLEVLNAGDVNWSVHHALVRSREDLPRFKPDIVILYEGINEETNYELLRQEGVDVDAKVAAGEFGLFTVSLPQCNPINRHSILYKLVAQDLVPRIDTMIGRQLPPHQLRGEPIPVIGQLFLGDLGNAIGEWQAAGAQVVYMIQANGPLDLVRNRQLVSYSRLGADLARRRGAIVVDAQALVTRLGGNPADHFASSGVHWNAAGATALAKYLYDEVEAAGGWRRRR